MKAFSSFRPFRLSRLYLTTLVALALLAGHAATAAPVNVLGFDDMSCAAWQASRDDPDQRADYVAWLRGFVSGYNYAQQGQQVSTISSGTIEQYLTRYCAKYPKSSIGDGAQRLTDEFSGRNQPIRK